MCTPASPLLEWFFIILQKIQTGTNDAGQFKPFLKEDTLLYTFDDNYLRELTLVPMGYLDIKGVNTLRYELSNATWQPSALYDQPIAGECWVFFWGGGEGRGEGWIMGLG